jgi:LysR family glycine cleavage system transcriptional activator
VPKRYPSLNALRIFDVAARHMSFTKAAEHLNMSQAAVSQRIKALEDYLAKPLFNRGNRSLELTDVAKAYLPSVRKAIERLDRATDQLFEWSDDNRVLSIRVASAFTNMWLAPRLASFQQAYPDINIRLIMNSDYNYDALDRSFDAEIRYGNGHWPDVSAHHLMDCEIFPVCAPMMLHKLKTPEDLGKQPLIHVMGYDEDWAMWLAKNNVKSVDHTRGLQVDATITAIQVAQEGAGVALGRTSLVNSLIQSGRLAIPFKNVPRLPTGKAYYLVTHTSAAERPELSNFRQWLEAEVSNQ